MGSELEYVVSFAQSLIFHKARPVFPRIPFVKKQPLFPEDPECHKRPVQGSP